MEFNLEKFAEISKLLHSEEDRKSGREELADLVAVLVGEHGNDFWEYKFREKIENAVASLPAEERHGVIAELQNITEEAGWETAHDIVAGALNLDKEIESIVGQCEQVKIYDHTISGPEVIHDFKDFINHKNGHSHFWIPRKYDIQRYVKTAVEAHARSGKSGTIKVLDIGGGAGFLGKLIADEAKNQGIELEVVVMDPNTKTVTIAKETYSDTGNLKFEIGTADQALSMFGPELTGTDKDRFDELEKNRLELLEQGKEELSHIKALLISLEGVSEDETATPDISSILLGAFGNRARTILEQSGIMLDSLPPLEEILDTLADFYNSRWEYGQQQILSILDEQEQIYAAKGSQAKVDMVLNSWMPLDVDFTRKMRMLNAPAIIYALETGGATGIDLQNKNPVNLGKECSYGTGDNYVYVSSWEGVSKNEVRGTEYESSEHDANLSLIHIRKGVDISNEELQIPNPSDNKKYAWEKSLEQFVGRERIDRKKFSKLSDF